MALQENNLHGPVNYILMQAPATEETGRRPELAHNQNTACWPSTFAGPGLMMQAE